MLQRIRGEGGFTLVETLAALLVFAIVTLGIVPLIISAMAGANVARSFTVGKNAALEAMERIRGLPYHVDYERQPPTTKVDVLDLFFPDATGGAIPGQTYAPGLFTTRCGPTSTDNPACLAEKLPDDLPGFELVVRACFIESGTECIDDPAARAIPSDYRWNPDELAGQSDDPPGSAQLMEISVTTSWQMGGSTRTYDTRTLLGDKQFGSFDLRGRGTLNNAVEVTANHQSGTEKSRVTATIASAESDIQSTDLRTSATQSARAALLGLLDTTDPTTEAIPLATTEGAAIGLQAPPSASATDGPESGTIAHPAPHPLAALGDIAFFTGSQTSGSAEVESELPAAASSLSLTGDDLAGLTDVADAARASELYLDTADPQFFLEGDAGALSADTVAEAIDLAFGGGVTSSVDLTIPAMRLLPTTAIVQAAGTFADETSVILVEDFVANVDCTVAANPASSAGDASWSADLYYWSDTTNNEELDGSYKLIQLGSGVASDPLAAITPDPDANPMVIEFVDPLADPLGHEQDVYLFPVTHDHGVDAEGNPVSHDHPGYLHLNSGWSSSGTVSETVADEGRTVDAAINQVLRLKTAPLSSASADSFISVSVGSMSCTSDDQR